MGLSQIINIANTGLRVTDAGLDIVARNVANADTPGYTRKTVDQTSITADGRSMGVQIGNVNRTVNEFLQIQLRSAVSDLSAINTQKQFIDRIDQLFGEPGSANALDTIINQFSSSLQQLTTSPDSFTVRQETVANAEGLASQLRTLSEEVQALRQLAEDSLALGVFEVNDALSQLAALNNQLNDFVGGSPPPDILDERDKLLDRLADNLEVKVTTDDIGRVAITSASGNVLLQGEAVELVFDQRGIVNAQAYYSTDDSERGVGTISLLSSSGSEIDLIQQGSLTSGKIGALVTLRDETLVEAQAQLDELAHNLALSMSTIDVTSSDVAVGAQNGMEIDLTGLQSGNSVTLNYTEGGLNKTLTIIRVNDPGLLPLDNSVTPNPGDTVLGIDFSAGMAAVVSAIQTEVGGGLTVSNPSTDTLRILDDGAVGNTDVDSLNAAITSTVVQDNGTALPLFMDGADLSYTGSLEGDGQKLGFASRIVVNSQIANNNELLVRYNSVPETPIGSPDRPLDLLNRLTDRAMVVDPATGIGQSFRPYSGVVADFAVQIVSFQSSQADFISREQGTQEIVTFSLKDRYEGSVGVSIDEELSDLITLEKAYAANARIIQVADELMQLLLEL